MLNLSLTLTLISPIVNPMSIRFGQMTLKELSASNLAELTIDK